MASEKQIKWGEEIRAKRTAEAQAMIDGTDPWWREVYQRADEMVRSGKGTQEEADKWREGMKARATRYLEHVASLSVAKLIDDRMASANQLFREWMAANR